MKNVYMKKALAFLLALIMCLSMLPASAWAEENSEPAETALEQSTEGPFEDNAVIPIDDCDETYVTEIENVSESDISADGVSFDASGPSLNISYGELKCGIPVIFTATVNGIEDTSNTIYRLDTIYTGSGNTREMLVDSSRIVWNNTTFGYKDTNTFEFTFMASGVYSLRFAFMDKGTSPITTGNTEITINISDPDYPSLTEICQTAVTECIKVCNTDFEKAVWLNDWLIDNCGYDNSLWYCNAEGALARHTGTCNAYTEAYKMLLDAAGIPNTTTTGNGHIWSVVQLDGNWYQVDTTWNDNYNSTDDTARHMYFGLTDELMKLAHSDHTVNSQYECSSLENNYFIKTGKVNQWSDPIADTIKIRLAGGETVFDVAVAQNEYETYETKIKYSLAAFDLSEKITEDSNGNPYEVQCTYSSKAIHVSAKQIPATVASGTCGANLTWTLDSEGTLAISGTGAIYDYSSSLLPPWYSYRDSVNSVIIESGVTEIGERAFFFESNLKSVTIGGNVTSIGAYTFAECTSLCEVSIPRGVTSIGYGAFENCSKLGSISFQGSAPTIDATSFSGVKAVAYYTCGDPSWMADVFQNYGGTLTWEKVHSILHHEGKSPSYSEIGWKEYDTCSRCEYTTYEELPVRDGWKIRYILGDERADNSTNPDGYDYVHEDITLATPTLNGYTFSGWYLDENLTTKATAPQIKSNDTGAKTFYAKWTMNTYSIKFSSNSGTGSMATLTKKTDKSGEIAVSNKLKRTGCKFTEWNTAADGSGESFGNTLAICELAPYADAKNTITLFAQWQPIEYTVVFDANGGTGAMESVSFAYGAAESLPANTFTKIGYTFAGWKCGGKTYKDGQSVTNLTTTAGATVTMVAQWKADTFKIAFDPNGGTGTVKAITATYDKVSSKLPSSGFKKIGWILKGWSLTHHDDEVEYSFDYQCGAALTAVQVNELYAGRDAENIVRLYAVWGPVEYKITYKNLPTYAKGSVEVLDNSMNPTQFCTQAIPELTEPAVPGYTFEGWFTDSKCTKPVTGAFWTGAAKTVYAKVTPATYSISYDLQGGTAPAKGNKTGYTIKTAVTLNNPTRYGYTFAGWYFGETKVTKLAAGTYYGGDIELTANWTPNSYTLVLNGNGGTVSGQTKFTGLNTDSEVELPSLADREVYRFDGWSTKNDATGDTYAAGAVSIPAAKSKSTVTLYAMWSYELAFDANGGEGTMESQKMFLNRSAAIVRGSYTKTGYYIAGWNTDQVKAGKGTVQYKDGASVKNLAGKTLYAVWKPITYTIVFNANGGTGSMSSQKMTYDSSTALKANAFKLPGYAFAGWSTQPSGTVEYTNKQIRANAANTEGGTVTLYAVWSLETYTITYELNGGNNSSGNPKSYTIKSGEIKLYAPAKKGYTFLGWYADKSFKKKVENIPTGSYGNVVLYAKWAIVNYSINYILNGGTDNANPTKYNIETPTIILKSPYCADCNFMGWFTDSEYSNRIDSIPKGSTGNKTLYAKWEDVSYSIYYVLNGGTNNSNNPKSYTKKDTVTLYSPTKLGYDFDGWYKESTFITKITCIPSGNKGNITLFAKWGNPHCCGMEGQCSKPRASQSLYCVDHTCSKAYCNEQTAKSELPHTVSNEKYCNEHGCYTLWCNNASKDNSHYCYEHECIVAGCTNEKENDSSYCFSHCCMVSGCGNKRVDGYDWCSTHKCRETGCRYLSEDGSHYCAVHKCYEDGCPNGQYSSYYYCASHYKCKRSSCNLPRSVGSKYCKSHTLQYGTK